MKSLNYIVRSLVLFSAFFFSLNLHGTVYSTTNHGLWTSSNNWSPSKPKLNSSFTDTIIINHQIDINLNASMYGFMIVNSGASLINTSKNLIFYGNSVLVNNGIIEVKTFKSMNNSSLSNNGTITSITNLTNNNLLTNNGTINANSSFINNGTLININTINVLVDFTNSTSKVVENYGVITILDDLTNSGQFTNEGAISVDGTAVSDNGTIDGDGDLCNSDGVTDPTGGAKGVDCKICKGESSTLPMTLVEFAANENSNTVQLHWATGAEINNNYFEILKSTDGFHFDIIGQIQGQGNSNSYYSYEFLDNNTTEGILYYQLRQVDYNGMSSLSNIIEVVVAPKLEVNVYPNPINKGGLINIQTTGETKLTVEIYAVDGQLVTSESASDSKISIATDQLVSGIYILRIFQNNSVISKKLQVN